MQKKEIKRNKKQTTEKVQKKVIKKDNNKNAILLVAGLLFIIATVLIYIGFDNRNVEIKKLIINEKIEEPTYKVYLRQNNFYDEQYLEKGNIYPSNLTDYIDINFKYVLSASNILSGKYTVKVDAQLVGEYENIDQIKGTIWTKKYLLKNETEKEINNTSTININENVKLDYLSFLNDVILYRNINKLAIDAYVDVIITIKYQAKSNDGIEILENGSMVTRTITLKVPITTSTFKITPSNSIEKSDTLIVQNGEKANWKLIIIGLALLGIDLIILLTAIIKKNLFNKNTYQKQIDKILKNYSEIIVEVSTKLEINDSINVIEIKTFEDMIDIEEQIKSPILYYEVEKNNESWFIIMTETYLYKYVLKK